MENKRFIQTMKEEGLYIINGRTKKNWEGEYTYIGARGSTVRLCFCKRTYTG